MLVRPEVRSWHSFAGLITLVFAGGAGVGLGQLQWRGDRCFELPRRGTEDQARPVRARKSGTGRRLRLPGQGEASESYLDNVLRDLRRYGIENTTDKCALTGAIRQREVVCTERLVGYRKQ